MSISCRCFTFCFLVALCIHWIFSFVCLAVVFVWWYSILSSSVSSFFKLCVSVWGLFCLWLPLGLWKRKFHIYSSPFSFDSIWSPCFLANSELYIPFSVFVVTNYPCLHCKFGDLTHSFVTFCHFRINPLSIFCRGLLGINALSFFMSYWPWKISILASIWFKYYYIRSLSLQMPYIPQKPYSNKAENSWLSCVLLSGLMNFLLIRGPEMIVEYVFCTRNLASFHFSLAIL